MEINVFFFFLALFFPLYLLDFSSSPSVLLDGNGNNSSPSNTIREKNEEKMFIDTISQLCFSCWSQLCRSIFRSFRICSFPFPDWEFFFFFDRWRIFSSFDHWRVSWEGEKDQSFQEEMINHFLIEKQFFFLFLSLANLRSDRIKTIYFPWTEDFNHHCHLSLCLPSSKLDEKRFSLVQLRTFEYV